MRFSGNEVTRISEIIGVIYDAVLNEEIWPKILETVCTHVGGGASRIYWRDASNGQGQTVHAWGFEPRYLQIYREDYVTLNPLYPASIFIEPGKVFSSQDLVTRRAFQASRFFREWVEPQGFYDAAIFNIQRQQASAAAFTIITGQDYGPVDERMRARLTLLAPHLHRAALISREVCVGRGRALALEAVLDQVEAGVFILDQAGRAVWFNQMAASLIAKGDVVRSGFMGLTLAGPRADRLLKEALAADRSRAEDDLRPSQAQIRLVDRVGDEWLASLLPLRADSEMQQAFHQVGGAARLVLFIRRATPVSSAGVEAAARHYRLTPAEVRVLHVALEIDTVANMARSLDLSSNTVKKHLSAIFGKTGVSRRADLIKVVLSAAM